MIYKCRKIIVKIKILAKTLWEYITELSQENGNHSMYLC